MKDITVPVVCPACGHEEWVPHTLLPEIIFERSYEVSKCARCGMGRTYPPPEIADEFYQENEKYNVLFDEKRNDYRMFAKQLLSVLDDVVVTGGGKRLVDIGCGGGYLVEEALRLGYLAEGIEANINVAERGRKRGLVIHTDDINKLSVDGEKFDVIVLSAILEHLEDPGVILAVSREMLTENGVIIISQADFEGLLPKIFPWGWYGWQPKEHYWHFNENSLKSIAERYGLKIIKTRKTSLYHRWYLSGGLKVVIGRNLATLIAKIGSIFNLGDSIDVVAIRKQD